MEKISLILILLLVVAVCYIIYDSMPCKYTKLDENFGGFIHRRAFRFEFEKSPLHTIIYGATGTGKTYFVRQQLKLYLSGNSSVKPDQDQEQIDKNIIEQGQVDKNIVEQGQVDKNIIEQGQNQKSIIIVCKNERDWINPETGFPYVGFELGDINMIIIKSIDKIKNSIIVLDDMGSEFSRHIKYYFSEGRHSNIQMIVMCHKPAQIDNMSRMNCDTLYITTYNGTDLFQNFNTTFKCDHKLHETISE